MLDWVNELGIVPKLLAAATPEAIAKAANASALPKPPAIPFYSGATIFFGFWPG